MPPPLLNGINLLPKLGKLPSSGVRFIWSDNAHTEPKSMELAWCCRFKFFARRLNPNLLQRAVRVFEGFGLMPLGRHRRGFGTLASRGFETAP